MQTPSIQILLLWDYTGNEHLKMLLHSPAFLRPWPVRLFPEGARCTNFQKFLQHRAIFTYTQRTIHRPDELAHFLSPSLCPSLRLLRISKAYIGPVPTQYFAPCTKIWNIQFEILNMSLSSRFLLSCRPLPNPCERKKYSFRNPIVYRF